MMRKPWRGVKLRRPLYFTQTVIGPRSWKVQVRDGGRPPARMSAGLSCDYPALVEVELRIEGERTDKDERIVLQAMADMVKAQRGGTD